jgi:hypothetical protein
MSLFKGILNFVKKPIAFVAKTAGAVIGLPALGNVASNLINSIGGAPKAKQMATAAAAAGAVSTVAVANTLEKSGVPPTKDNVLALSQAIQEVAVKSPDINAKSKSDVAIVEIVGNKQAVSAASATASSAAASTANSKTFILWDYIKSYWYFALPSGLLVVYLVYKSFKK